MTTASVAGLVGMAGRAGCAAAEAGVISAEWAGLGIHGKRVVGSHNYRVDDLVEAVAFLTRTPARSHVAALVPRPSR